MRKKRIAQRAPHVMNAADRALRDIRIARNPYFTALADGSMTKAGFQATQEQFFFAVTFFSRPMAALVGRVPDPHARLEILHNLVEEHGEFEVRAFHHNTFRAFLRALGSDPARLERLALWPELRAFNSVLTSACVLDELEVGISCMGIIERAFAGISAAIGNGVVQRGWISGARLVHYELHAAIDDRHAEEFFAVIEPAWKSKERRHYIEQGLEMGAYIFNRLYLDLYERSRNV
jgi:pyrroloquinoline-quinone synthase